MADGTFFTNIESLMVRCVLIDVCVKLLMNYSSKEVIKLNGNGKHKKIKGREQLDNTKNFTPRIHSTTES